MATRIIPYVVVIFYLSYYRLWFIIPTVLASTPNGPEVGAIIGRGGEGTISDGAGRGGAVAVQTIATETPVEQHPGLTAAGMTGALVLRGTYRTVGSISFRLWVGLRMGFLPPAPKKVESMEGVR